MIYRNLYSLCLFIILTNGCNIYSFSGASIPEKANTISIHYIENQADLIQPTLSNNLTESLIQKWQTETTLIMQKTNGDLQFFGKIIEYKVQPIAIQNNETAAQNRLTISVEINYINTINNSDNFKQNFIHYSDFNSDENFLEMEETLNNIIIENLVEDIFNKAFMNW